MGKLIPLLRSIIPACDVPDKSEFENLIKKTYKVPGVGAYKLGLELTIQYGLKSLVEIVKKYTNLPTIYDHQKAGTDIPALGTKFSKVCRSAGVEAVILFPFGGMATERNWIKSCQDEGLVILVGAHMTQENFLYSEGGFIADDAPKKIFQIAAECGITDFVVPGNKPKLVAMYEEMFEELGIPHVLYAPGFISQGGVITECGKLAGENWHAIVGTAIYQSEDIEKATRNMVKQL